MFLGSSWGLLFFLLVLFFLFPLCISIKIVYSYFFPKSVRFSAVFSSSIRRVKSSHLQLSIIRTRGYLYHDVILLYYDRNPSGTCFLEQTRTFVVQPFYECQYGTKNKNKRSRRSKITLSWRWPYRLCWVNIFQIWAMQ